MLYYEEDKEYLDRKSLEKELLNKKIDGLILKLNFKIDNKIIRKINSISDIEIKNKTNINYLIFYEVY